MAAFSDQGLAHEESQKKKMGVNRRKTKRCQYRFLHLDLIDLDAEQLVLKLIVEIEPVSVLNIFPTGVLIEYAGFSAGQGLQRTPELSVLCER